MTVNTSPLPAAPMSRRRLLAGLAGTLVAVPALATVLAACGDPDAEPAGDTTDTSGSSPTTSPPRSSTGANARLPVACATETNQQGR